MNTNQPIQEFGNENSFTAHEENLREEILTLLSDYRSGFLPSRAIEPQVREALDTFQRHHPKKIVQYLSLDAYAETILGTCDSMLAADEKLLEAAVAEVNIPAVGVAELNLSSDYCVIGDFKRAEEFAFRSLHRLGQGPQVLINLATALALSRVRSKITLAERIFKQLAVRNPMALRMNLVAGNLTAGIELAVLDEFRLKHSIQTQPTDHEFLAPQ